MKVYYLPSKELEELKERVEAAESTIRDQKHCIDILFFAGVFALIIGLIKGCTA